MAVFQARDSDLYLRGAATLVASWEEYARGAVGAEVVHLPGVAAAVFPNEPERAVYNVGTLEHARRRGLGTALTALLVHDALARGCRTASLQSTEIAERVYAIGFRDLGRFREYVPKANRELRTAN